MKRYLSSILVLFTFLLISCNTDQDFTDPSVLSGTTWRCNDFSGNINYSTYDYLEYKFITTDSVQTWVKQKDQTAQRTQTIYYTIHDCFITLFLVNYDPSKSYPIITIGKNSLSYNVSDPSSTKITTLVFSRQKK